VEICTEVLPGVVSATEVAGDVVDSLAVEAWALVR